MHDFSLSREVLFQALVLGAALLLLVAMVGAVLAMERRHPGFLERITIPAYLVAGLLVLIAIALSRSTPVIVLGGLLLVAIALGLLGRRRRPR